MRIDILVNVKNIKLRERKTAVFTQRPCLFTTFGISGQNRNRNAQTEGNYNCKSPTIWLCLCILAKESKHGDGYPGVNGEKPK